ncbi:MAG: 50S ribosomal protein L32 [Planctomycetota bacterium]|nr:MAG: 50S ribosomal protein L32 [Planctomycetota bacterium]
MAVPRRKHSRARQAKRRAQWKGIAAQLVDCSHCGSRIRPHTICMSCGHYRGRQVLAVRG